MLYRNRKIKVIQPFHSGIPFCKRQRAPYLWMRTGVEMPCYAVVKSQKKSWLLLFQGRFWSEPHDDIIMIMKLIKNHYWLSHSASGHIYAIRVSCTNTVNSLLSLLCYNEKNTCTEEFKRKKQTNLSKKIYLVTEREAQFKPRFACCHSPYNFHW